MAAGRKLLKMTIVEVEPLRRCSNSFAAFAGRVDGNLSPAAAWWGCAEAGNATEMTSRMQSEVPFRAESCAEVESDEVVSPDGHRWHR